MYFNPSSGSRNIDRDAVRAETIRAGLDFVEIGRESNVEADVIDRMKHRQTFFLAAGGDGTINHVAQPLVHTHAVLGVLAMGTFNHFARDLNLPLDWRRALKVALSGPTRHIDVARVNDRYFLNNISLGLYPEAVEQREKLRGTSKLKAYLYASLTTLQKFPHVSLVVETPHRGEAIRTHIFMVSVNPYDLTRIGLVAPRVSLQGGRLAVYWLPHMPKLQFIRILARYVSGKIDASEFRSIYTTHLKVQSSRSAIAVGMDGEVFKMPSPLLISIEPKSLAVKVADSRAVPRGVMVGTVATG